MTELTDLERRYRRLLGCYPRAYRREHETEMSAVLLAGARAGQRWPGPGDSVDLIRGAIGMRLRPRGARPPRTVVAGLRLMILGAVLELGALVTVVATLGNLHSAILERDPSYTAAQWHAEVVGHIVPIEVGAPIAAAVWLWLAWANGRGHRWARTVLVALVALTTASLLSGLLEGAVIYCPADAIAGGFLWCVALAAVLLIWHRRSAPHYRHSSA